MSHNITTRDGMFTVREPAWHDLQSIVFPDYPTRWEAQSIAHPWEPETAPLFTRHEVTVHDDNGLLIGTTDEFREVPGWVANTRSDTGDLIGVVSDTFENVGNDAMWDIAEAIEGQDKGSVRYETGGSLKGGSKVWLLLRLNEPLIVKGDPRGETIPYFGLQNAFDGSGAFRGQGTMTRIVCHESGTPMLYDGQWITVDDHPSALGSKAEAGLRVSIAGLPFSETVTLDHRYWAARPGETPRWVEAQDLAKGEHEIVYPVNPSGPGVSLLDDSDDLWWAIGLWWGDGHLHGTNQITWTVSDQSIEERLMGWLRRQGFKGQGSQKQGCKQITWACQELYDFLAPWYSGEGAGKGARPKSPPLAVAEQQFSQRQTQEVVAGYFAADGSVDVRGGRQFTSTNLDGLLVLRQMLARLGRTGAIRQMRRETKVALVAGHMATVRPNYTLRESPNPDGLRIVDGAIHSRVKLIEWVREAKFVPVTTADHTYITAFGRSHNCDNTAQMADMDARMRGTEFVFRHTRNVHSRIEQAKAALAGWKHGLEEWRLLTEHMITLSINSQQRELFLERFVPAPPPAMASDRVMNNVEEARQAIRDILGSVTCEGIAHTAYGLVQASIEYSEHHRRARSDESRFNRAYLTRNALVESASRIAQEVAVR